MWNNRPGAVVGEQLSGGSCPGCSCPGHSCPGGSCPGDSYPWGSCPCGSCPWGSCLVTIIYIYIYTHISSVTLLFLPYPTHRLLGIYTQHTAIHPNYIKWLGNFLSGRHAFVEFRGMTSRLRHLTHGVPQGSVLSPTLFNLFMHDLPVPTNPSMRIASYADDLTVISQAPTPQAAAALTQTYMGQLELWLATNRMEVDPGKCILTLVTPYTREYATQPRVTLNGIPIPVETTLHFLGVTLDRGMTFRPHVQEVSVRARYRLGVLRAVTGTTFGNSK